MVLSEDRDGWVPSQHYILGLAPAGGHHVLTPECNLLEGAFRVVGAPAFVAAAQKMPLHRLALVAIPHHRLLRKPKLRKTHNMPRSQS